MGGGGGGDSTIRYAEYFETAHKDMLEQVFASVEAAKGSSPYGGAKNIIGSIDDAFFSQDYDISSFPALWDMFGKFMAGVDVHVLWQQTFNGVSTAPEINAAVTAQAAYLDDDIDSNVLPRFQAGMRNINAVQSSAFMTGRALIEDSRIKAINKFASEIRLKTLDISVGMWSDHLKWNESVIVNYSNMYKLYYAAVIDANAQDMDMQNRDALFDLNLYEYARAMLGVISGAQGTVSKPEMSSTTKAISGAMGGAAMGASVGGPWGAAIGGILGLAASFL